MLSPHGDRSPYPTRQNQTRNLLPHLIVGGTALGVSVGAFFSYQVMRKLTLLNLQQNALSKVEHGTDEIDSWLATLKARVEMLAHTEQVRSVNWSVAKSYLKAEDARIEDFSLFGLTTLEGWRDNTATNQRANVRDRQWFQKAMSGEIYVDDPMIARATGLPSIGISAPIRSGRNLASSPIGVVHGAVKVDRVARAVNRLKYGNGSYAFALNSEGRAITTDFDSQSQVKIVIADNGVGMPETVIQKIFNPYFTTKPVGKGTGMGLSISYQIVVEKHRGQLECVSTPGCSPEFIIQIPVKQLERQYINQNRE